MPEKSTDFGFRRVAEAEKAIRVKFVFDSVADRYDLMNDLMSFGLHRAWKRFVIEIAAIHRETACSTLPEAREI